MNSLERTKAFFGKIYVTLSEQKEVNEGDSEGTEERRVEEQVAE